MRRHLASLLLVLVVVAQAGAVDKRLGRKASGGGGGGGAEITDDFAADYSSSWTEDYLPANFSYDGTSDEVDYVHNSEFSVGVLRHNTALSGDDGYAKVVIKNWGTANASAAGLMFRGTGTPSGNKYEIAIKFDGVRVWWARVTGGTRTAITYSESCGSWVTGDTMGVDWSGTGAGTTVHVWRNPSGSYGSWGAASCTFTDCGSTCADSGTYVGIAADGTDDVSNASFDDFEAGTP